MGSDVSADLELIMEQEREWLFQEALLLDGGFPVIAVQDLADLRPPRLSRMPAATLTPLVDGSAEHAQVQIQPAIIHKGRSYRFLWTHVDAGKDGTGKYRAYYKDFLNRFHDYVGDLPRDHQVDHLYSEDRARKLKLSWIRMTLIPEGLNKSHGASNERARGKAVGTEAGGEARYFGSPGRPRHLDWLTLMKLFLVRSPGKSHRLRDRADIQGFAVHMAARLGVDEAEVLMGIENLRQVAAFVEQRRRGAET